MKKLQDSYISIGIFCLIALLNCSCSKFLEVDTPVGEISSPNLFNSESSTEAAVVGLYSQSMTYNNFFLNGGMSLYAGLSADEFYNTSPNPNFDPYRLNALNSSDNVLSNNLYRFGYAYIYQANLILENLQQAKISEGNKMRYSGEMLFMRSLCYFYLVNLWGDVPLILNTDSEINRLASRTSKQDIYSQIITDLKQAEAQLQNIPADEEKIRADVYSVKLLLARVYLYLKDYQNAFIKADELIKSGKYAIEQDPTNVFKSSSTETILQFRPTNAIFNTAEGFTFLPASPTVRPQFSLYEAFIQTFENGDDRLSKWSSKRTVGTTGYYFPNKYKVRTNATKTEYNIVLRLAEAYLIRSESAYNTNRQTQAINDLIILRKRAALADLPLNLDKEGYEAALMKERAHELFAEWGHRWLDLKRWNKCSSVLAPIKPDWNASKELFPIPNYEIMKNPKMTQNDGYNN